MKVPYFQKSQPKETFPTLLLPFLPSFNFLFKNKKEQMNTNLLDLFPSTEINDIIYNKNWGKMQLEQ